MQYDLEHDNLRVLNEYNPAWRMNIIQYGESEDVVHRVTLVTALKNG